MVSFIRSTTLVARASKQTIVPFRFAYQPRRFASSTYGDSQSGHRKSDAPNPQVHQEHPGPEAPADQGKGSSSSSSSEKSPESTTKGAQSTPSDSSSEQSASNKSTDQTTSSGAKPALHREDAGDTTDDPSVKKHNDDMRKRADQTPNQVE